MSLDTQQVQCWQWDCIQDGTQKYHLPRIYSNDDHIASEKTLSWAISVALTNVIERVLPHFEELLGGDPDQS